MADTSSKMGGGDPLSKKGMVPAKKAGTKPTGGKGICPFCKKPMAMCTCKKKGAK